MYGNEPAAPEPGGKSRQLPPLPENRYNITDHRLLDRCEDFVALVRGSQHYYGDAELSGKLDVAHLRQLHAFAMQDLYSRPGATREDELRQARAALPAGATPAQQPPITDGRYGHEGQLLAILPANHVNKRLDRISEYLEATNMLGGLEKPAFVNRLAQVYLDYAKASPFTGGNQAVLGIVAQEIGQRAGYQVRPDKTEELARVTDAALAAGPDSAQARRDLVDVLSSVTTPDESREGVLARHIVRQRLEPIQTEQMLKQRKAEDLGQAGD